MASSLIIGQMQQPTNINANANNNNFNNNNSNNNSEFAPLHMEMFDFLCTFHRVKRIQSKDTTQCGQLQEDQSLSSDQRVEQLNRSLYKILIEIEAKITALSSSSSTADTVPVGYFDEWSFLCWSLLSVANRLESDQDTNLLDYGGKHFKEKIHAALVELVNKAHRMQPPPTVQPNDQQFERFYQAYVTALISLHELYTLCQQKCLTSVEFEAHLANFKKQLVAALALQRDFSNCHGNLLWRKLREHQIHRMTHYGYDNRTFMDSALSFYAHMLYNLGVLAARIQGFSVEIRSNKSLAPTGTKLVGPLLDMVYGMADVLLGDSIICLEPSVNPILVTNNLFPMKIVSLCRFCFFRDFSLQIVSEEVAQQIQQEMRHRKTFDPPSPVRKTPSAALLAMKPATGVKRNNAKASEEGGNTAHKKSDVNSRECISIPPLFDAEHNGWCATYPHLLCTTRQKDSLLDARSAMQTGKRPLFYFHVRAEFFSFAGTLSTAHTLSMPFTIATRRNQDCQVQRMMSSYTATCFWLYGTNVLDGLLIQWFDGEIDWKHFKLLYSLYFAMNAEVKRTFTDEDFTILQHKMRCPECSEGGFSSPPFRVSFKNVLCPHLHFSAAKCDLRFSVWRGMLELLHLFNDAKTETRHLWECGLLLGLMEMKTKQMFDCSLVSYPTLRFDCST
ncbi:hypothetical protein niasHS_000775 [Heterodera schachtii]|uniref:Uncharacterized protein n=1 Tax=Heterodera schachtii TaxID=97005 RepID=A0ABD2KIQ6_HETSC